MGDAYGIHAQNGLEHERRVHGGIDRRVGAYEEQFQPLVWKLRRQGHLLDCSLRSRSVGSLASATCRWRTWSIKERRAAVSSQASGFCGTPSRGQVVSAATSALLRASSALATSRVFEERWATRRP